MTNLKDIQERIVEEFTKQFGDEHFVRSWGYEECACDFDEYKNKHKPKCMSPVIDSLRTALQSQAKAISEWAEGQKKEIITTQEKDGILKTIEDRMNFMVAGHNTALQQVQEFLTANK